jgi:SulP family sulfate permease
VVALEVLEKFLAKARADGLTVLLAGVRGELAAAIGRVGIGRELPPEQIFPEEDEDFSATLKAIRRALALRAAQDASGSSLPPRGASYYLV